MTGPILRSLVYKLILIWQPWKDDYSLYFLLGKGPDSNTTENLTIKKAILEEYQKFDDIVIGQKLTMKSAA